MGGQRKVLLALYLIIISLTPFLSACAEGVFHTEINQDGSADLRIHVGLNEKIGNVIGGWNPLDEFRLKLERNSFKVNDYQNGDYTGVMASKHFPSIKVMMDNVYGSHETLIVNEPEKDYQEVGHAFRYEESGAFFYTTYRVNGRIDIPNLLQEQFGITSDRLSGIVKNIGGPLLEQLDLQVKLTLPYQFGLKHNATAVENGGKTLVWVLDPADENLIELELSIPDVRNIVTTAIIGCIVAASIFMMVARYRK